MLKLVSPLARDLCSRLADSGHSAYVVGGAVRDLVLNNDPADYDIATSATPNQVQKLFRRVIPTGIKHGTVTVLLRDTPFEVTTYRTEEEYSDGRRPDNVTFVGTIDDDLARRDFTMNGMALDPIGGGFLDPFSGESDLRDRQIRAIRRPAERFAEDSLRILRAIRFAAQLEFNIEPATWRALCELAYSLDRVSSERVREELNKVLASSRPSTGFRLMRDSGVLSVILPELQAGVGVIQRGGHAYDVFEHSLVTCDMAPSDNQTVRLAALLHDIGKPASLATDDEGERKFHGHDAESAAQTETLLRRLRYPNAVIAEVRHLVAQHMFHYAPDWSDSAVRRFLARVGPEHLENLFLLRQADSDAQTGQRTDSRALDQFRLRISEVLAADHALSRKDLAINGHDLIAAGLPSGPLLGVVIDHLFEAVLDDPSQNTKEQLLGIAMNFYRSRLEETGDTGAR